MTPSSLPVIRLKPKTSPRGILRGYGQADPDHPMHPMLAESGYLKALFFRL